MSRWYTAPYLGQNVEHIPGLHAVQQGTVLKGTIDAFDVITMRGQQHGVKPGPQALAITKPENRLVDKLRPYQQAGVLAVASTLRNEGGAILADGMGLGKTAQTLAIWDGMNRPWPLLVVAPASVRRGWVREFKQWLGLDVKLVENGKQADKVMPGDGVVITSYELAGKLPAAFVPHMLVVDEAHLVRGRRAKRSETLHRLASSASYRLALSGTPMWGRPRDLYQVLKVVFPDFRFGNADAFDYAYCGAFINKWGGKENRGATRTDELQRRLSHIMVRRTLADVGDQMPSLTRHVRWIPSDKKAKAALQAFALGQLHLSDAVKATLEAKLESVVDAVVDAEGHAVVFTWQKKDVHELVRLLEEAGIEALPITGDMTPKQREATVDQARAEQCAVVATIDSTGTGVDGLQHVASTVMFHALDYTPIKMAQAESRCHRIGQKNPVVALFFAMEDSADTQIVEKVVDKLDAWRGVMGADATGQMHDVMSAPATAEAEAKAIAEIYAALNTDEDEEE